MVRRFVFTVLFLFICSFQPVMAMKEETRPPAAKTISNEVEVSREAGRAEPSIKMLHSIIKLKKGLNKRIDEKNTALNQSSSDTEKELLKSELEKLDQQVNDYSLDFERIATGIDTGLFVDKKAETFDWKSEVVGLVEPGIKEIKRVTVRARNKTKLKDERFRYEELAPVTKQAVDNITHLISRTRDKELKADLEKLLPEWQALQKQVLNKLEIVNMRLAEMESEEKSFIETSRTSIKHFFRTRGLFLAIAVIACCGVFFLLRIVSRVFIRFIPGYTDTYRPFHVRMLSLVSRMLSFVLMMLVLVFVFYAVEDWVLLSLTIIFIMGIGWAAKHTLPSYWHQSRLMLNIGAVREGERIMYNGVPWLVKDINLFSELENPSMGVKLRLPIEELLGKTSRKFHPKEPWFPCRRNDWVILSDGTRGVVTSLSHEMVEMVQRGGAHKTYLTGDFLSLSPLNLSMNFRLKIPFGISYELQKESTAGILETMQEFIDKQIETEGYKDSLLNLRVEFQQAAASSLDMVVIADFKGDMAPLYQRLTRAIQRWCVDACTENNWDIPFPQLTVHKA